MAKNIGKKLTFFYYFWKESKREKFNYSFAAGEIRCKYVIKTLIYL